MKEKRVGVANFSNFMNYGAALLSYALIRTMDKLPGVHAELINYSSPVYTGFYPIWWDFERWGRSAILKNRFMRTEELFRAFHIRFNRMDPNVLHTITAEGFDCCCVGSDKTCDYHYAGLHGFEFLLPHVSPETRKIAYAVSMGNELEFPPEVIFGDDPYAEYLPSFQAISVREKEIVPFMEERYGKHVPCVLDPTLLLDAEEYYPIIADRPEKPEQPYLMVYYLDVMGENNFESVLQLSNRIAQKYGLKIIHTLYNERGERFCNNGGCMLYGGVEDFIWYMKNASFVVTNTYHGTIFSIQFERPFYVFPQKKDTRIRTLRSYTDFEDRCVNRLITYDEINRDIDFGKLKRDIFDHREASLHFLRTALDIEQ